jgi:hypothetical protein
LRHPRHPSCLLIIRASGEAGANYRRYARPSVLSFERFLFTARHHMSELPDWAHPMSVLSTSLHSRSLTSSSICRLAEQISRVLREELVWRETLVERGQSPHPSRSGTSLNCNHVGIQEISTTSSGSKLKNRFDTIDEEVPSPSCRLTCDRCFRFANTMTAEYVPLAINFVCSLPLAANAITTGDPPLLPSCVSSFPLLCSPESPVSRTIIYFANVQRVRSS